MTDVRDGKRTQAYAEQVPAHIEVYEHEGFIALWDEARWKHVAIADPVTPARIKAALVNLGIDPT